MSLPTLSTLFAATAMAVGAAVVTAGPAAASSACSDAVAGALHTLHDVAGDPGGLVHGVEETYCTVAP